MKSALLKKLSVMFTGLAALGTSACTTTSVVNEDTGYIDLPYGTKLVIPEDSPQSAGYLVYSEDHRGTILAPELIGTPFSARGELERHWTDRNTSAREIARSEIAPLARLVGAARSVEKRNTVDLDDPRHCKLAIKANSAAAWWQGADNGFVTISAREVPVRGSQLPNATLPSGWELHRGIRENSYSDRGPSFTTRRGPNRDNLPDRAYYEMRLPKSNVTLTTWGGDAYTSSPYGEMTNITAGDCRQYINPKDIWDKRRDGPIPQTGPVR